MIAIRSTHIKETNFKIVLTFHPFNANPIMKPLLDLYLFSEQFKVPILNCYTRFHFISHLKYLAHALNYGLITHELL